MEEEQYLLLGHAERMVSENLHFLVEIFIKGFISGLKRFDEFPFDVGFRHEGSEGTTYPSLILVERSYSVIMNVVQVEGPTFQSDNDI